MKARAIRFGWVIGMGFLLGSFGNAFAASTELDFFKGKVISYIVATKPGGGYDTYARLIGKYVQKYIPGSTVVVKNVPGAGHIIGANEVYLAKPDGLTIGTFNTGLVYAQIVGQPGIKFDLAKFSWIGKANTEKRVLIVGRHTSFRSLKDLMESKSPIKMASAGVGSAAHQESMIVGEALGLPIKMIPGYSGREGEMAMMRGEVDGQLGSYVSLRTFIKSEGARILLQVGATKHPEIPDVPLALDLKLSPRGRKLASLIAGMAEIWRPTVAPPNVPAAKLAVLRDAYEKALNDPRLREEARKAALDLEPGFGDAVAELAKEAVQQPEENVLLLKKIIQVN